MCISLSLRDHIQMEELLIARLKHHVHVFQILREGKSFCVLYRNYSKIKPRSGIKSICRLHPFLTQSTAIPSFVFIINSLLSFLELPLCKHISRTETSCETLLMNCPTAQTHSTYCHRDQTHHYILCVCLLNSKLVIFRNTTDLSLCSFSVKISQTNMHWPTLKKQFWGSVPFAFLPECIGIE